MSHDLHSHYLHSVRNRFHPLHRLRGFAPTRAILQAIDIPVWTTIPGVAWKVRVRLIRHASVAILPGGAEPGIAALFTAILHEFPVSSFWDVGSNIGYYAWIVKTMAPNCNARLFEPDPANASLIWATAVAAKLGGLVLREVAVSDVPGQEHFIRDDVSGLTGQIRQSGSTFSEREWGVSGSSITVQTVTLDEERKRAEKVDLIKIDVEGHEERVIQGALSTIKNDRPILIIECFHGSAQLSNILHPLGYWIGDADRMDDPSPATANFLALPAERCAAIASLKKRWSEEIGFSD